jgi:type II restriction/modification system DNA methylase subunit YeeA
MAKLERYIITPRVSKYRIFDWLPSGVVPDSAAIAIVRDDDTTFGLLHSRFHEIWSLGLCTWLGVGNDPRYTPTTTFETFPFPDGLAPSVPAEIHADEPRVKLIAAAAKRLVELRNNWLNPSDLVRIVPEVVAGLPDRVIPIDASATKMLNARTLTNLYNQKPQWLLDAHRDLDAAVAEAYGWPVDISDADALKELLALNLARSGIPSERAGGAYVVDTATADMIDAVEGIEISPSMKAALAESPQGRSAILKRLKQVTR